MEEISRELGKLHPNIRVTCNFRIPIILVTHDVFEAYSIADRIIVYSGGRVVQTGRPEDVFGSKEHPQVSKLLDVEEFCRCGLLKARGTPPDSAS